LIARSIAEIRRQRARRSFAYANNYLIDVKFGVIVDVEASRAIRQAEVGAARTSAARLAAIPAGGSPANRGVQTLL
jgi:hypothetical protein